MSKALETTKDFEFHISQRDVWQVASGSERELTDAMANDSARAVAIVGAALIEDRLTDGLERCMRPDKKQFNRLTDHTGPLGSFSQKAALAYMLGILSKEAHHDLDIVRRIRNDFAHSLKITSFECQQVKSRLNSLQLYKTHIAERKLEPNAFIVSLKPAIPRFTVVGFSTALHDLRQRYLWTIQLFLIALATIDYRTNLPKL